MVSAVPANRFIALLLFSRFHSCKEFEQGIKNSKGHSSDLGTCWPGLIGNSFYFFLGCSHWSLDQSVWHNGKHPRAPPTPSDLLEETLIFNKVALKES